MSRDPHIDEIIQNLESLAKAQSSALKVSKEIIALKNRYIELCEMETALYKKQVSKHGVTVLVLSVMLITTSVLLLCNL